MFARPSRPRLPTLWHRLLEVRTKLYELVSHCISPELVIKTLAFELVKLVDGELKGEIMLHAAFYVRNLYSILRVKYTEWVVVIYIF